MDILDIITTILPKEILPQIITYGLFYFLLIFYGSTKWGSYSSFEKIVFSVISGGIVWYFLSIPISFFFIMLKVFQNEMPEIKYIDLYPNSLYILYLIFLYLLIWRLIFNNKPLRDNDTFFNFTKYSIISIVIVLLLANYTLFTAFLFSEYQEYITYIQTSILLSLGIIILFYPIFLALYGEKISTSQIDDMLASIKSTADSLKSIISRNKTKVKGVLFIVFIIILITAALTGKYFLKTTTQIAEEKSHMLVIENMFINRQNVNLSGYLFVWQNYSIKFGLIPYAKIKPNISFKDRFGDTLTSGYNFSGDYLLIKNSSWNKINVILYGRKEENNISKFYTLDIKDLNDTIQMWKIKFNNSYPFDIEINYLIVEKSKELKFINYTKNNLRLNEIVNDNPTDHQIAIRGVGLPYEKKLYPNQSITLFFEKTISN